MRRVPVAAVAALVITFVSGAGRTASAAETDAARGAYLVRIAACSGCHTPKTPSGLGPALSGGRTFGAGPSALAAANITPDRETGIGAWTDAQIAAAIHEGVRPGGSRIGPPMPQIAYHAMRDDDVRAIVAYLRSVPAVSHAVPQAHRTIAAPHATPPAVIAGDDLVARGRYLANAITHCTECHTPGPSTAPDFAAHLDAGGRSFSTAKGSLVAPPITPDALRRYSDAELATLVTKGRRADGSMIEGPMPIAAYAHLAPDDVRALIAYLRKE